MKFLFGEKKKAVELVQFKIAGANLQKGSLRKAKEILEAFETQVLDSESPPDLILGQEWGNTYHKTFNDSLRNIFEAHGYGIASDAIREKTDRHIHTDIAYKTDLFEVVEEPVVVSFALPGNLSSHGCIIAKFRHKKSGKVIKAISVHILSGPRIRSFKKIRTKQYGSVFEEDSALIIGDFNPASVKEIETLHNVAEANGYNLEPVGLYNLQRFEIFQLFENRKYTKKAIESMLRKVKPMSRDFIAYSPASWKIVNDKIANKDILSDHPYGEAIVELIEQAGQPSLK